MMLWWQVRYMFELCWTRLFFFLFKKIRFSFFLNTHYDYTCLILTTALRWKRPKTIHPGRIRTRHLLFLKRTRWPLSHAASPKWEDYVKRSADAKQPVIEMSARILVIASFYGHLKNGFRGSWSVLSRVARFFLTQYTKTRENIPSYRNFTKWP
jgi:hypothetical protein